MRKVTGHPTSQYCEDTPGFTSSSTGEQMFWKTKRERENVEKVLMVDCKGFLD